MSKDDSNNEKKDHLSEQTDESGQVIQFPLERLKAQRKAKRLASRHKKQQKVTLFLSLAAVFVLAAYFNQHTGSDYLEVVHTEGMERMVANSLVDEEQIQERNSELASELDDSAKRYPASYGRRPSAAEKLRYKTLGGKYKLRFSELDGGIASIKLDDSGGIRQRAVGIGDGKVFLDQHRDLFSVSYKEVRLEKFSEELVDENTAELYNEYSYLLIDGQGNESGRVIFKFNMAEHLLQMKVQENRSNIQE